MDVREKLVELMCLEKRNEKCAEHCLEWFQQAEK